MISEESNLSVILMDYYQTQKEEANRRPEYVLALTGMSLRKMQSEQTRRLESREIITTAGCFMGCAAVEIDHGTIPMMME